MDAIKCSFCFLSPPSFNPLSSIRDFPLRNRPCRFRRLLRPTELPLSVVARDRDSGGAVGAGNVVVVEKSSNSERFQVSNGFPSPFGATVRGDGVNFAIYSANSVSATLCLIALADLQQNKVTEEISLNPSTNRTGDIWHVFLKGDFKDMLYGYRFEGKFSPEEGHYFDSSNIVLDPYAKAVISRGDFGGVGPDGNCWPQMACMVPPRDEEFDWEGDMPLKHLQKDLVIYEMHVRGFTRHESSKIEFPGTYLGVVKKLDHLKDEGGLSILVNNKKASTFLQRIASFCFNELSGLSDAKFFLDLNELGVNCIELMPCHEFNELEYFSYNTVTGSHNVNFWGYSTVGFFAPMIRYSSMGIHSCGGEAINEFKFLVREAHKRGIEVIMDVVFNHTAEGNEKGPIFSFRGVDNSAYYVLAPKGEFYNYSGCGNTFNCNHPVVRQFIVDCLRYWVTEMHVDGFRFDLASIMSRSSSLWDAANVYAADIEGDLLTTGTPLSCPPLIDMISNDPILRGVKLIAEAWDAGGLYQVGTFPHWGIWSEWNGKYRDVVRQFIKGTDGFSGGLAECLCGSPNLYKEGGRKPWNSINFICAHDGFTLADLVTYNNKHNLANGEDNNDGENHNNSWNCGQEGEFASISVKKLRKRQMRNFFVCLMVSQGVPMFYMGDEYGHTKGGNNNTYCHDNYMNYFRWDKKEESSSDFFRFCHSLIKFRGECESLGLNDFPTAEHLQWHGHAPGMPDWSETSRFVAFSLVDSMKGEIYVAFNASHLPVVVSLPERPGFRWEPFVDTSKPPPFDCITPDLSDRDTAIKQFAHFLDANLYPMLSYSSVILLLSPVKEAP